MHIGVVIANYRPEAGGGHTFVQDIAAAFFATAGESAHTFTVFAASEFVTHARRNERLSNVRYVEVPERGGLDGFLGQMKNYAPVVGYFWRRPGRLDRLARTHGIDLLWFLGGPNYATDTPYIATVWDVQHLTHPWFPEVGADGQWLHREQFLATFLRRASAVITGTRVGRDELIHYYRLPDERILILPHPTPRFALEWGEAMPSVPAGIAEKFAFYPAQFWPHKNHANLLLAWRKLVDRNPDAPALVLVGSDQGNRTYVERMVAELGLADKVVFLGFVPIETIVALYRLARMLVYPSFSGPENLPPLEAFALGCPVAASDFPGAREQLGEAALLFDPMDPDSIADTVSRMSADEELRQRLIERGYERAGQWTAIDFVRGVLAFADRFAPQRRAWPSG